MKIGIPKETKTGEARVALTPEDCGALMKAGAALYLETTAGVGAGFSDQEYLRFGVEIVPDAASLYGQAQLIVKVKEPQTGDLALLTPEHHLFCYLHLAGGPELTQKMAAKKLTATAFETVRKGKSTPLLAPMSAIAGRLSVLWGSNFLHSSKGGKGVLLGGTIDHPQGEVLVLGGGVAGREAAKIASSMGARVRLLDINPLVLDSVNDQMPEVLTDLSDADTIEKLLPGMDLVVGAVYQIGKKAPFVLSEAQIELVPKGAVLVDIAIDQGGCFATSKPCTQSEPYFIHKGIIHSAVTNMPAAVPRSASIALSKAIHPYVLELATGIISPELAKGLNLDAGKLVIEL